jgi:hypothetical protein
MVIANTENKHGIIEGEAKVSKFNCPNRQNHVSAEPAYDRVRCPFCHNSYETPVYVQVEG